MKTFDFAKDNNLNAFASILFENGFDIMFPELDKKGTYFHFSLDNKIGYAESPYYGGIKFSTVHKPCKECGTGFAIQDYMDSVDIPTIEDAKKALVIAPNWASQKDIKAVKKYESLEDYAAS